MQSYKEIFIEAKALVEKGWIQGPFRRKINGQWFYSVCGALAETTYRPTNLKESVTFFMKVNGIKSIMKWDNVTNRTKQEVLAAFDKAIAASS